MVCYSHLFQNFPQFVVIHTVKGFGIVNKAEIDVFLHRRQPTRLLQARILEWVVISFSNA